MNLEGLRKPEFQEKLKGAKTPEELLALARDEGVELTDAELEGVAGGSWDFCADYRGDELDQDPGWN